jgi:hypothetical protein
MTESLMFQDLQIIHIIDLYLHTKITNSCKSSVIKIFTEISKKLIKFNFK